MFRCSFGILIWFGIALRELLNINGRVVRKLLYWLFEKEANCGFYSCLVNQVL